MISANGVTLRFGKRTLFENVNIKFTPGNCYGLIGANGAGKTTFLKILSKEIEPSQGDVTMNPGERLSVLKQNHHEYEEEEAIQVVMKGNQELYQIMKEKEAIYAKPDFSEEDGIRAGELEARFAELDGWNAESDAGILLNGLGVEADAHHCLMKDLNETQKVKVLLAQALFGNPDVLLLDEPTNYLDIEAIEWLEEFLINFENTVIVVSHDRYFLNTVCTHIADIDFGKIQVYTGNYDFWYESSQLALKQMKDANKKKEDKIKELQDFIRRFSANASKSRQATSRKKLLEKIELDEIKPSNRKYPYIHFEMTREPGKEILFVENLSKTSFEGKKLLNHVSINVQKGDKIAFVGPMGAAKTELFDILTENSAQENGDFKFGITTSVSYFRKDNSAEFQQDISIVEWLMQYSSIKEETFVRGFLGRMLFSGEEALKKVNVLSGGEKVRCMLAKMMLSGANILIFDEPTNHLDLESIQALNNGLIDFKGVILFTSHDHQFVQTIANRIIEITPNGVIDKRMTYDEYLESDEMAKKRENAWAMENVETEEL